MGIASCALTQLQVCEGGVLEAPQVGLCGDVPPQPCQRLWTFGVGHVEWVRGDDKRAALKARLKTQRQTGAADCPAGALSAHVHSMFSPVLQWY